MDAWLAIGGIESGIIFRCVGKTGSVWGKCLSEKATYHHESINTENKESQWGIEVESGWGPPVLKLDPNQKTDSVRRYEFRLFFLPVPNAPSTLTANYWTQELIANLKNDPETSSDMIDFRVLLLEDLLCGDDDRELGPQQEQSLPERSGSAERVLLGWGVARLDVI